MFCNWRIASSPALTAPFKKRKVLVKIELQGTAIGEMEGAS